MAPETAAIPSVELSDPDRLCQNPLVSVLMITYNHERYIGAAIEGVINQKTDFPFELIIGEDCSPDNTRAVALDYQKRYPHIIRVIVSDRNVGMHLNSKRMEKRVRGEYIAVCEGDDRWSDQTKLQKQITFLEQHPDYGAICTSCEIEKNGVVAGRTPGIDEECDVELAHLLFANIIPTLTVCCRRSVSERYWLEMGKVFRDERMGDLPLWCWMSLHSKIRYIPACTAVYRHLEESASHSLSEEKQHQFAVSAMRIRAYFLASVAPAVRRKLVSAWVVALMPNMLRFSDREGVLLLRQVAAKQGTWINAYVMRMMQVLYPVGGLKVGIMMARVHYFAQELCEARSLTPLYKKMARRFSVLRSVCARD